MDAEHPSDEFFPALPDLPDLADLEPSEAEQPEWLGPPHDVLPGVVPLELLLGRSDSTAVALTGLRAYPTGLSMRLLVHVRGPRAQRDLHDEVFDGPFGDPARGRSSQRLRWGFELADGRRVTSVDADPWGPGHTEEDHQRGPERPVLMGGGGGGSDRTVERDYWLWPLPPAGPLRVVCEWRAQGIALTDQLLDATPFREAAVRARPLWE